MEQFETFKLEGLNEPPILLELTNVIKEWSTIWKQLYVSHHSNFYRLEKYINNLINLRNEMSNRKLLFDQQREKQKQATLFIDIGNKFLKLDMVVRDEHGNIINPLRTPIIWLYDNYVTTTKHINNKSAIREYRMSFIVAHFNKNKSIIYLPIKNINQTTLLYSVDFVKTINFLEAITTQYVKNDFYTMMLNGQFSRGVNLLSLLHWKSRPAKLLESLRVLKEFDQEELLIFLHDVLDALFNIYKNNPVTYTFDTVVFDCLIYIIELVSDENHWEYKTVLDLYINEHFNAEMAYSKLLTVLNNYLNDWNQTYVNVENVFRSFKYIMKFIVRSKSLSSELNNYNDQRAFENTMNEILTSILNLMRCKSDSAKNIHKSCLKCVPQSVPEVTTVFNNIQLSSFIAELLDSFHPTEFVKLKLVTMNDIVHSRLFLNADCRAILLSRFIVKITELSQYPDVLPWCKKEITKLCGDILDLLYTIDEDSKFNDISEIMTTGLHFVIQMIKIKDREELLVEGCITALMISILHQMTDKHYTAYIKHLEPKIKLLNFLKEIMSVFTDIVSQPIFPDYWCDMIMLQNRVILRSLKHFAQAIREQFFDDFEEDVWKKFFRCIFTFLLQPSLQLEQFTCNKRSRIVDLYKDMRIESVILVQTMWSYLRLHKVYLMPHMVGLVLETSLIPENELRKIAIPILFDMMQCEFYSYVKDSENNENSSPRNVKFDAFQNKVIENIDRLVINGKGDEKFKELFKTIMIMHCENNPTMRDQGIRFVSTFSDLFERLLEYQTGVDDDDINNKINYTVNVLNFYKDIQQYELTISYVNKLCSLHLECNYFTEAAYTLKVHSDLLSWSNDPLPHALKSPLRYPTFKTHRQLKEALLKNIIDYFNRGKMWECALVECEELIEHYKHQTYEYTKLSSLLHSMSKYYDNIMNELRTEPKYYRIAYYGKGFPMFLQNKVFIYRGKEYEGPSDLYKSIMHQYPYAIQMQNMLSPGPEITNSSGQCILYNISLVYVDLIVLKDTKQYTYNVDQDIQIGNVKPIIDDRYESLESASISEKILQHYRVNHVQKFNFSQKSKEVGPKKNVNNNNKFAKLWIERTEMKTAYSLPSMVRWCLVTDSHTYQVSPLQVAIETMEDKNSGLKQLIMTYQNDQNQPLHPLSMTLHGILDPAVMGGVSNYEEAFFTPEYLSNHKEDKQLIDKLKSLIISLIPLLDVGLKLHKIRVPLSMSETQSHLEKRLKIMKKHIEENYTEKTSDITSQNCFDITFYEQRYNGSHTKSAEVLVPVTRPNFITSNSVSGYPDSNDFSNLTFGSNKYYTLERSSRNNKVKKILTRILSTSLDRLDVKSNVSQ